METLIWCFLWQIALWWRESKHESLYIPFLLRQVVVPANTDRKKGYCIPGDWSCSSISTVHIHTHTPSGDQDCISMAGRTRQTISNVIQISIYIYIYIFSLFCWRSFGWNTCPDPKNGVLIKVSETTIYIYLCVWKIQIIVFSCKVLTVQRREKRNTKKDDQSHLLTKVKNLMTFFQQPVTGRWSNSVFDLARYPVSGIRYT